MEIKEIIFPVLVVLSILGINVISYLKISFISFFTEVFSVFLTSLSECLFIGSFCVSVLQCSSYIPYIIGFVFSILINFGIYIYSKFND